MDDFKNINVGKLIHARWVEEKIEIERTVDFIGCTEHDIEIMFQEPHMNTDLLLRWSKLLKYDFFRIYSQHLILFAPPGNSSNNKEQGISALPSFRKNIYTKEIIEFVLELIDNGIKTKAQIVAEYGIPKTTLHKWINKHKKIIN